MTMATHARTEARRAPGLPIPTRTAQVFGLTDIDDVLEDVQAVVTLEVAMTREMLAAALDVAAGASDEDPDTWSVEWIRQSVELQLCIEGPFRLQQDAEGFAELLDDPSIGDRIRAEYRAVDRAYPVGGSRG